MKVIVVDDEPIILRTIENILIELDNTIVVETFDKPSEALNAIVQNKPDLLLFDRKMEPIDGPQLKKFVDAIDNYDPYCVLVSGAPQYTAGFDAHVVKPILIGKLEHVIERYKNRSSDYLRDYLEGLFSKKTEVDFLYNLINTKEVEKHDLLTDLIDRIALIIDIKPDSARRRLFKIIKENENVFDDGLHYSPSKFIEKLKSDYKSYFEKRLFCG